MPILEVPILGRLGNILFQYCHARKWCELNGYTLAMYPWIGEKVWQIPEAVRPDRFKPDVVWPEQMFQHQKDLIYTHQDVRGWLQWKPEILDRLRAIPYRPLVLNLRHCFDCLGTGLPMLSFESVENAARKFGYDPAGAHWETDAVPTTLPFFRGDPNGCGRGTSWVCIPSFYRLQSAPVLFRAASTFSWWAATLSNGKVFAPVIRNVHGGIPDQPCDNWVEGNWPAMTNAAENSDLHLKES